MSWTLWQRKAVHEGLFSNSEKMGGLSGPLFPSINLDHARDIEGVDSSKRVRRYQHDARVCVDLLLGIAETDGLQD